MSISLVMPNYNHAPYLPSSAGAMLSQTKQADEVIFIDDASTDNSLELLTGYSSTHSNVRLLKNQERCGVVPALNQALAHTRGDLVGFLGADDAVFPNYLAKLAPLMAANPQAAFACARVRLCDGAGKAIGERPIIRPSRTARYVPPGEAREQLRYADNFFLGQVVLYRTERLRELGGFDPTLGSLADGLIQRRLAVRWGYVFVPEILGIWRLHGTNYSSQSVGDLQEFEAMLAVSRDVLQREPAELYPPGYPALFERRLRFNAARLLAMQIATKHDASREIVRVIQGGVWDETVLSLAGKFGPLASLSALSWLACRLRPFSTKWMLGELVSRANDKLRAGR